MPTSASMSNTRHYKSIVRDDQKLDLRDGVLVDPFDHLSIDTN